MGVDDRCYCLAVGFRAALHPLRGELHPSQLGQQITALLERNGGTYPAHHRRESRSERGAGEAQLLVSWNHTVAAIRAVVLRLAQLDRPEHGHDGLSSVGDELREMT